MFNKKLTRVAAAFVCGAIVVSSASVTAFAANSQNAQAEEAYIECRGLRVAQSEHGTIEVVDGLLNRVAVCGSTITVKVTPDEGYTTKTTEKNKPFTTGTDADWDITQVGDNLYTFVMPWCDPQLGVEISAKFITNEQAAQEAEAEQDQYADLIQVNDGKKVIAINVAATEHGKIEVNCTEARNNEEVIVKVIPDEGYVAQITDKGNEFSTGTYVDWNEIFATEEQGVYTFKMPWLQDGEDSITISAAFVPAE